MRLCECIGARLGLLPEVVGLLTVRELDEMLGGYHWRLRHYVRPFALQSFITQGMFSKDVVFTEVLRAFEASVGLPRETD